MSHDQPWGPNSLEETTQFVAEVVADAAEHKRLRYCLAVEYDGQLIGAGELWITDFTMNGREWCMNTKKKIPHSSKMTNEVF